MEDKIKELDAKLQTVTDDRERVDILYQLAGKLFHNQPNQSLVYSQQAYELARNISYLEGIAGSLKMQGHAYFGLADYHQALIFYNQALELYVQLDNKTEQANVSNAMGILYYRFGNYSDALENFLKNLELNEQMGNYAEKRHSLNNIAAIHCQQGRFEDGLKYYGESLKIARDTNNRSSESICLNNMGTVYLKLGDNEKALSYYLQSLEIEDVGKGYLAEHQRAIGVLYIELGQYKKALDYLQKSLIAMQERGDQQGESSALLALGNLWLKDGDLAQALNYTTQALKIAEQIGDKATQHESHNILSQIYKEMGDFEKALSHYEMYHQIDKELFNEESDQKLKNLQIQFQVEQKEKEAEIYRQKNEELAEVNDELEAANQELVETQLRLVRTQAQRIEAEKLATLGELAGMVAHEMNNILSGITGPIEQILNAPVLDDEKIWYCWESDQEGHELEQYLKERNQIDVRIREAARVAGMAGKRAKIVVQDLQDLIGDHSRELGTLDVGKVFQKAVRLHKEHLERIKIIENFDSDDLRITARSGELGQIFTSLLRNSNDALKERENPTIWIRMFRRDGGVEIQFRDNGCGMSEEVKDHIFEPLFTTKGETNAGLGLSTTARIIGQYGGTINVESTVEKGTTFTLWFPYDGQGKSPVFVS